MGKERSKYAPNPVASHPWKRAILYNKDRISPEKFREYEARYLDMIKSGVRDEAFRYVRFQVNAYLTSQRQEKLS